MRLFGLLVGRIALNCCLLLSNPTQEAREKLAQVLQQQAKTLRSTLDVLNGKDTLTNLPEELSAWLAQIGKTQDTHIRVITRMAEQTDILIEAVQSEDDSAQRLLQTYIAFGQGAFFAAVTTLTDHIWVQIETGRSMQLEIAMKSATRPGEGLTALIGSGNTSARCR
ncbi:hypothetical protein [Roseobacter fucihabitans]|uniref:hypothetical protein n=1 Tax=Roseobacter fucihabitans TaxID=1537242 RepID=UPI001CA30572|nr:hypothetical protein [Roseobacter litoralis]